MDIDISLDYGLTLLAALLIGTGFVLQQNMAQREPDAQFLSLRLIIDLFHEPRWLLGIGCMVAGQGLAACRSATCRWRSSNHCSPPTWCSR